MSWCDKLASVAAAGFRLSPHFASSDAYLDAWSPILDPLWNNEKPLFSISHQSSFEVTITAESGFVYAAEPTKVAVTFRHRMRARSVSAGPPVMEMLSHPMPYTQLLPEVLKRLREATLLLPASKDRAITRVGIISTTTVAAEDAPPGITRFIEYMGRPWSGLVDHFSFQIVADLEKGQGYSDRCIHSVSKPEDKEQLMTITLDWQRSYTAGNPINVANLKDVTEKAEKAALKYFEDVGEGSRFDEKLIRDAAGI